MGCNCHKKTETKAQAVNTTPLLVVAEAADVGLPQCYECAKKHLSRAKEEFKEYHTGYPQHIKNLIQSVRAAENDVREAFLKWNEIQAQLDMSAGEFLGRDVNKEKLKAEHIAIANDIRLERLRLNENPNYIPRFDDLLVRIQVLEYSN